MSLSQRLRIGLVTGYHGLRGHVKVRTSEDEPGWLKSLKTVWVTLKGQEQSLKIAQATLRGPGQVLMRFSDFADRTAVEKTLLKGTELFADVSELPSPTDGEYFADELIGMAVYDSDNPQCCGLVKDFVTGNGQDFLEIGVEGCPSILLVPFTAHFVLSVHRETSRIEIFQLESLVQALSGEA